MCHSPSFATGKVAVTSYRTGLNGGASSPICDPNSSVSDMAFRVRLR